MKHIISLGAGVQSSTMALMAAKGEITPMPDAAVFADTQAEPQSVYEWLGWLETQLPFKVHRVTASGRTLMEEEQSTAKRTSDGRIYRRGHIPAFPEGGGILPRQCTRNYKILPLLKELRRIAEIPRGCKEVRVISWIGISTDEVYRMKAAHESWVENRWPLVDLRMNRQDCLSWMERNGYPKPPRSACVFCPFHSDSEWARLKREEPIDFNRAVWFERGMQKAQAVSEAGGKMPYLHRSCRPLDTVIFEDKNQRDLFNNECEGMCGV